MPAACDPDVADIEDIANFPDMIIDRSVPSRKMVMPRVRKRHKNVVEPPVLSDSYIPGENCIYYNTIYLITIVIIPLNSCMLCAA